MADYSKHLILSFIDKSTLRSKNECYKIFWIPWGTGHYNYSINDYTVCLLIVICRANDVNIKVAYIQRCSHHMYNDVLSCTWKYKNTPDTGSQPCIIPVNGKSANRAKGWWLAVTRQSDNGASYSLCTDWAQSLKVIEILS